MRFGIVGAGGYWGPNWVRVLNQLGVLAAVCEADPQRREAVVNRFELQKKPTKSLSRYEDMLAMDLDGIFVVTNPVTHDELAVQALRAGKHIFVEKPLADTLEQSYRIKFEAEQQKKVVMVGHTFIYHPAVQKFREALPMIGTPRTLYTVRTNFGQYQDVGVVKDLLPHDLSIFNYLCQRFPDSIKADVNPYQDVAYVTVQYGSVVCNAFLSWGYPDKTRKLAAVGDRGILEWDLSNTHLLFHKKWAIPTPKGRYEHHDEGLEKVMVYDQSEPLMNEALHFIECIREGCTPLTGVEDGISVVKGIEACL